jgi:carboxylesterase
MDAVISLPGAEPWSAAGGGRRARTAVVILHGFTANPIGTRPLGQRLAAEGYRVEVPCLPGHGTSPRDLATTRYADWYGAAARVLDHLGPVADEVVVVGHSMGATIALDLAARRPDAVAAVVAINPQILDRSGPLATAAPLLSLAVPYLPRGLAGLPTDDLVRDDVEEHAYGVIATRAAQSLLAQLPRIRAQLIDVTQPLLVVRSRVDHTVDPANGRAVMALVGSADLREFVCERSYHVPLLDHDAPAVEDAILAFLATRTGATRPPVSDVRGGV